jgi:hypothetical protein
VGPTVSEGERGKIPVRDFGLLGRGPLLAPGRMVSRGSFTFFFVLTFSLFCFSDLIITFAFWIQIDSNQFLKISKIQSNILRQ